MSSPVKNLRKSGLPVIICLYLTYMIYTLMGCSQVSQQQDSINQVQSEAKFIGEKECKSCHASEHEDWVHSDHYMAMQQANDSTVLGDFNNAVFTADGVTNKFFKKNGKFIINTQGEDGENHDYEVLYAFGYFPLQQYLIAFPGGRMQSTRVSWNSREKKWFHQYTGEKIYHKDWLHWTGNSQNWNTMCASCHSTDLKKNYNFDADTYATTWKEMNVSCESCHGPGSKHTEFMQSEAYAKGEKILNAGFIYSHDTISKLQARTCAPCHARKSDLSSELLNTGEILDDMIPQLISSEFYFADGQIKEEDYEYGSFVQSKMFAHNVRCSNCHNPHSGKLKKIGNELCTSCHTQELNSSTHHFHQMNTAGAQCINCHMPEKTYMGADHRRDHSFRIPRPDQSVLYGTPNTCNSCHKDKSTKWAANAIVKWYGPQRKYHFSDDLAPGSLLNDQSETHLIKLLNDITQPEIARATAADYLGSLQTLNSARALVVSLKDKKAMVRMTALNALKNFEPSIWITEAGFCLSDKVRGVRIAAADLYHRIPVNQIPASYLEAYRKADAENRSSIEFNTDFSVGNVKLADYEMQGGDQLKAIKLYLRGLEKDSLMNYARLNLASAYSAVGKNQEALKTLQNAAQIDSKNDRVFYNLGLLFHELGNPTQAISSFERAVELGSVNSNLYYNFGLVLQQENKSKAAELVFLKGIGIAPQAANLNYALAYFYLSQNKPEKAYQFVKVLKSVDPNNPDYLGLFEKFRL